MPSTLDDLYRVAIEETLLGKPSPTTTNTTRSPLSIARGLYVDAPIALAKGFGGMAMEAVAESFPPTNLYRRLTETPEQLKSRVSAMTLGIPQMYENRYKQELAQHGEPKTVSDKFNLHALAATDVAAFDIFPLEEMSQNLTGQRLVSYDQLGQPVYERVSDREYGKNIVMGALKMMPFAKSTTSSKARNATASYDVINKTTGDVINNFVVEGMGKQAAKKAASDALAANDQLVMRTVTAPITNSKGKIKNTVASYELVDKQTGKVANSFPVKIGNREKAAQAAQDIAATSDQLTVQAVIDPVKVMRPETQAVAKLTMSPTVGEIEAGAIVKAQPSKRVGETPMTSIESELPKDALAAMTNEYADKFNLSNRMSPEHIRSLTEKIFKDEIFQTVSIEAGPSSRTTANMAKAIKEGALDDVDFAGIIEDYGLPDNDMGSVRDAAAAVLSASETGAGQTLQPMSALSRQFHANVVLKAQRGDAAAIKYLHDLDVLKRTSKQTGAWHWAMNKIRGIEGLRLSQIVGAPVTAARNMMAYFGIVHPMQILESRIGNVIEGGIRDGAPGALKAGWNENVAGPVKGVGGAIRESAAVVKQMDKDWANVNEQMFGLIHDTPAPVRDLLQEVMDASPLMQQRLMGAHQLEVGGRVINNLVKRKLPVNVHTAADAIKEVTGVLNHTQEIAARKNAFSYRLAENLKAEGLVDEFGNGSFTKLIEEMKKPEFDERYRLAIADAETTALQNTFALQPVEGGWKVLLDVYKQAPILTAIATPFPRFLANQWKYLTERSPTHFSALFSPEFRSQLAQKGMAGKQAQRQMAQATSGLMMLAAAYTIRSNEEWAGPRYYQAKSGLPAIVGETPGKGKEFFDGRPYDPFAKFMAIAEAIYRTSKGLPLNFDENELLDLSIGMRGLRESPLFAVPDIARAFASGNNETIATALATPAGQWLSSWFTTAGGYRELVGGLMGTPQVRRDVEGQELLGPAMSQITPTQLPVRNNAFTGTPVIQERPVIRQGLGITIDKLTPLEEIIGRTPGLNVNQLTSLPGAGQEANALMAKYIGQLLIGPSGDEEKTIADIIIDELKPLNDQRRKEVLQERFSKLRNRAMRFAQGENIEAFEKYEVDQKVPGSIASPTLRYLQQKRKEENK